ncbi:MAG: DUF6526 family protein [Acidobacteriaceae bacterium]|nr:DUF6526 family protein [Acidobacteriaceae bacterium]
MTQSPQSFEHHAAFDPLFHIALIGILTINLVVAITFAVLHPGFWSAWMTVLSLAVFIVLVRLRQYPLKVQDRIIRLEERLRLQSLAPAEWHAQIDNLSEDQLIGLRFASDDEVVELAKHALEHKLTRKQIKERIRNWRADYWRI